MTIDPSVYPAYAAECGDPSRTRTLGFGSRPALVLIDVCKAYMSPNSPLALPEDTICSTTSAIISLLQAARTTTRNAEHETIPIFYAQTLYTNPHLRDAGMVAKKQPYAHLFSVSHPEHLTSVPDARQFPELQPKELEMIHPKKFPSAFFGTNFATQLATLGVDTVIIAGYLTSVAVRSTAIDAMQAGFRSIAVSEACADRGHEAHWANLMDHNAKYGDVVEVEAAVEAIKRGWF